MRSEATDAGPAGHELFDDVYRRLLAPFHPEREARVEVAGLRELLGLAQDDRILDLGCGWGRHLVLLRAAGHDVTGLDASRALLDAARRREAEAGVGKGRPVGLVRGEMRALPFRERHFDAVLNLATSLGLFLDDPPAVMALAEARRVLRPGGRLVLEGMHRDDVVAHFATRDRWRLEDRTEVRARRRFDAVRGVSHEVLRWRGPDGSRGVKRHALRVRSATELVGLVERADLAVRAVHGDLWGRPFHHDSGRIVLVAERL